MSIFCSGANHAMTPSNDKRKTNSKKNAREIVHQSHSPFDWFGGTSLALCENQWVTSLFIVLFVILSFLYFPSWGGGDYDMWWHFSLGKYYISHHTMKVNHALFSWTPADPNWLYNTWLGSTIEYLFYTTAGGFGLWLFQWSIFAGIFLFFLSFVRATQGKLDINATFLIFMTVIVEGLSLVFPKPELFTPLFFVALVSVFFSVKRNKLSPRYFYLYPIMFAIWVNLHGGFIIGLGIVAILFVTECLNYIFVRRNAISAQGLVHLVCSLVLLCLACLLNPDGWAYPWDTITVNFPIFKHITGGRGSVSSSLIAYLPVWPFLLNPSKLNWWTAGWVMTFILFLFFIVSLAAFKKKGVLDISLLFLNPFLFYYGMNTVRACILFPTFAFFSIFYTMEKANIFLKMKRFTLVSITLFLFLGAIVLIKLTETSSFNYFGTNLEETIPVKEVEMIKKLKLPPPLFNDYVSGGYMIWAMYPEYKVFIDSRAKPYDTTHVWEDHTELMNNPTKENIQKISSKYPFRVMLINLLYVDTIFGILDNAGDEWRLLFLDRNAAILVHKSILPGLGENILRSIDISPSKFREVKSPETLSNLFLIYVNWASRHGVVIRNIYNQNVSNFYRYKKEQLATMDGIINEKMAMEKESTVFQREVDKNIFYR
jgi:hypothetical protein